MASFYVLYFYELFLIDIYIGSFTNLDLVSSQKCNSFSVLVVLSYSLALIDGR